MYCGHCDAENFYDREATYMAGRADAHCWRCHKGVQMPPRLRIKQHIVVLNRDSKLYAHHIDDARRFDFSHSVAVLIQNPQNPSIWGLTNLSESLWIATFPNASVRHVEPGRSVALARGLKINFGKVEGEIRV